MSDEDCDDDVNDSFESSDRDSKEEDPFEIMDGSNETDTSGSFGNDPYGDADGAAFDDAFLFDPVEFEPLQEDFETDFIAAAVARLAATKKKQEQEVAGNTTTTTTTTSAEEATTEEVGPSSNAADDSGSADRPSTSSRRQPQSPQDPPQSTSDGGKDDGSTTSDTNVETGNETDTARLENSLLSSQDEPRNNNNIETPAENDLIASFEAELSERQKARTSIKIDEDGDNDSDSDDSSASESCAPSTINPDENHLNSAPLQQSPQERRLDPPSQRVPSSPDPSSSSGSAPGSPGYSARTKELRKRLDAATRSVPAPPSDESSTEQPRRPLDDSSSRVQSLASSSGNSPEASRSSRADPSSRMSASHGNSSSHQTSDGGDGVNDDADVDVDVDDDVDDNYDTDSSSSSEENVSNDGGSTEAINEDSDDKDNEDSDDEDKEEEFGSSESDSDSNYGSFYGENNGGGDGDDDDVSTDFEEYEDSVITETPFFAPTKDLISPGLSGSRSSGSRSESMDDSESTAQEMLESFKLQNLLTPISAGARIFEDNDDDNSDDREDDGDNDTGYDTTGTGTDLQYSITSNRSASLFEGNSLGFSLDATSNSLAYSLDTTNTLEHLIRTQNFVANDDRDIDKQATSKQSATEREENDRKGGNNDGSKSRSGSRRVDNQTRQPDDGDEEMTQQPSKAGISPAGSATISESTLHSLHDEVRELNPTFNPRQQQLITKRSQDHSSSSNTKSSSSGSKSYSERLTEMLRPFNTDHTQSSRMRNTCGSFGQTESDDIRSVTVVDPEDSTMTKSTPEESIQEDSTMSRSTLEDSSVSRNTDMAGSSNEEHNTLHSMLATQDDSSYYSSDDARSSDEESAMVDTFMMKSTSGSKYGNDDDDNDDDDDDDDDTIDDGDVESELDSDDDSAEEDASLDQSLTTRRRSSGSNNHEIQTRSNKSRSGRSISSIMNETPESSVHFSESTTATASTAQDEDIAEITRNLLLKAASQSDHDDTSIIDKNAEEFDHSEINSKTSSASDLNREDEVVGDIARNLVLKAIGATNVDVEASLPDENKDTEKELSQVTSKKALKRIGDDGSIGISAATSNLSSKNDDIGDIARKIMLQAIGSSEDIESRKKSDEIKQVLRDSEKNTATKIERIDNDRIHGESVATPKIFAKSDDVGDQARKFENTAFGISEEVNFSDETSNASDALGGSIVSGESTSKPSSSVMSDDVGNIARNILLKAMGVSTLNDDSPSFNDTSPSANDGSPSSNEIDGSPSSNENNTGKKVDNDECEDSTTVSSLKSDNIAALARNIVNAAMATPERRNLFGEESVPSVQHIETEKIEEGKDRGESAVIPAISVESETFGKNARNLGSTTTGTLDKEMIALEDGDDGGDSSFTPFSIESDSVGEIARKLVNAAITNSNSSDSPSREHSESEDGSESLGENSDNTSLSSGEIMELDNLLDSQENGEETDENRLYELDLYDRWQNGEHLNDDEIQDLLGFKERRRKIRRYKAGLKALENRIATGKDVNRVRNLLERERAGEDLKEDDAQVIADFRKEEGIRSNSSSLHPYLRNPIKPNNSQGGIESSSRSDGLGELPQRTSDEPLFSEMLKVKDNITSKLESSATNTLPTNVHNLNDKRGIEEDLEISSRLDELDETSERILDQSLFPETSNAKDNSISKQESSDANVVHTDGQHLSDPRSNEEWLQISPSKTWSRESTAPTVGGKEDAHKPHEGVAVIENMPEPQSGEKTANYDDQDDYSSLSSWELDELDDLVERQERGFDVPESRLRNLELFDKWQNDEALDGDDLKAVDRFKKNRKRERGYGRELINLIESKERGEEIDFDRLTALELFARHHTGEKLTEDELETLTEFERGENESTDRYASRGSAIGDKESDDRRNTEKLTGGRSSNKPILDSHDEGSTKGHDRELTNLIESKERDEEIDFDRLVHTGKKLLEDDPETLKELERSEKEGVNHDGDESCNGSTIDSHGEGSAILINPKRNSEISLQEPSDTNARAMDEKPILSSHSSTGSSHAEEKHRIIEIDIIDFNDSILVGQDKNDFISSSSRGENDRANHDDTHTRSLVGSPPDDDKSFYNSCQSQEESAHSSASKIDDNASAEAEDSNGENIDALSQMDAKATLSSNPFMIADKLAASSLHEESCSSREPILSVGEMDEMQELLDREENGESVDDNRIYELDLLIRWQVGETLKDDELVDVYNFKAKRKKQRESDHISQELAEQNKLEEEARMATKKRLEEKKRVLDEEKLAKLAEQKKLEEAEEEARMAKGRKRLEEKKRVLLDEEKLAKLAEQKKIEEEARMAKEIELIKGLELKKNQEEQRRLEEEARLVEERLKMETEQRRMRIETERKQLAKDARLAEERILAKQKLRKKLEKEAQVAEENRISRENERKKLEIDEQNLRDINYSAEIERATEEINRGAIKVESTNEIISATAILGEEDAPSFTDTSNSSSSYDVSLSRESQLSIWEMDELNELLDREENGESVDEDRIYELDLFSRHQVREKLGKEEIADLDKFRQRRRKHRLDTKPQTIQADDDRIQRQSPLYDHDVFNGNSSRSSESSQRSEMDGQVIDKHIDLETTNQPMNVVKDEPSLASSELIDSISEKPSSASNFQAHDMSEGTGDDASLGLCKVFDGVSKVDNQEEHILDTAIEARKDGDTKDLNNDPIAKSDEDLAYINQPTKSPPRNVTEDAHSFFLDNSSRSDSRSFSMSIVSGTNESKPSKPAAVEAANLKSRQPSPSSLPSQRKREKQRSKQNKKRHDSSSVSSSSVRSQNGDEDKLQRTKPLDDKKGHKRIESGSRSLSSSNQSGYSGNDSKSFNSSKKAAKPTEREIEIVMPKTFEKKTKKEDKHGSPLGTPRSKRRDNKQLSKGVRESIPPRPTSSQNSRNKKHKRHGNASRGSSENDSKESNIDDRVSISMKSISSRSSNDKQDSDSLQSSGWDSSQSKDKKPFQTMGTRNTSNRKNESTKAQKDIPRAFTPKGKKSEPQDNLQTVESVIPSKAMEKAFDTLHAWDTLYEGPSQNSEKATKEVSGLEDIEKQTSSWAPTFDWNPFAHIKQRSLKHGLYDQSQNNKPDPPIVNVRTPQEAEKPQEVSQIEESIYYVNRMTDDSSVVSNWGPPSLLKTERKQKYSYVHRKDHFEMHSELSSYPKEYEQEPPHKKEAIHPHHHGRQHIPFVVRTEKSSDDSPKRDSRVKSDGEDFKGFDPDLLLSSWGLPVLEKVTEENPMRSEVTKIMPKNVPTCAINIESTQDIPGVDELDSAFSITSHSASLTKERRFQSQDGKDDPDGYSQDFIELEESIGESSDFTLDFDLEQGISKLKDPLKMSRNAFEDGSNSRSSSSSRSSSVEIIEQSSIDQSADIPQDDSQIGQSGTQKKRRRSILPFVILCLILLALIAGGLTALFVFLNRRNNDESTPTTQPVSPVPVPSQIPVPQTPPPTLSPIFVEPNTNSPNDDLTPSSPPITTPTSAPISENGDDNIIIDDNSIFNLIVANAPDGGASLKDPSSPQSAALSWLQNPMNKEYSDSRLLQRYALATLYYATNPNNNCWKTTSLWLTDTNECDWHSTRESPDTCTTTTITKSDGSSIENIVYVNLDLRENGLKRKIPDEISLLTSLKTIRLSKNGLTGSIPSLVTTLTQLEHLDLSSNQLVEHDAKNTGDRIQFENDDERNVYVDATTMSADEDTTINIFTRRTSNEATTATTMIKMNGDTSSTSSSFLSQMRNMQSLIHLDIFENSFKTTLSSDIWGEGSPLSSTLQVLNLGSNQFFGTLPTEIGFLTKLTGLSVFGNDLTGQLPASISQMTLLELLYIDSNKFQSTRFEPGVPQAICDLRPEPLREFWANCEETSCPCCTTCCSEDLGCVTT